MKARNLFKRLRIVSVLLAVTAMASAQNGHIKTGPELGEPIPRFEALDQHGESRSLEDLTGPNGLLLLFHRSADW